MLCVCVCTSITRLQLTLLSAANSQEWYWQSAGECSSLVCSCVILQIPDLLCCRLFIAATKLSISVVIGLKWLICVVFIGHLLMLDFINLLLCGLLTFYLKNLFPHICAVRGWLVHLYLWAPRVTMKRKENICSCCVRGHMSGEKCVMESAV